MTELRVQTSDKRGQLRFDEVRARALSAATHDATMSMIDESRGDQHLGQVGQQMRYFRLGAEMNFSASQRRRELLAAKIRRCVCHDITIDASPHHLLTSDQHCSIRLSASSRSSH
jgi:hypothetical protein